MKIIKLNTGIITRFKESGEVKVTTPTEDKFIPYLDSFDTLELWEQVKQNRIKFNN